MIGKLTGIVDRAYGNRILVDVRGVGYEVRASEKLARSYSEGDDVSLWIETLVREDMIRLYGFRTEMEQTIYRTLTAVQGVGSASALSILSVLEVEQIVAAIRSGDDKTIALAQGVGPKIAKRICSELREKIAEIAVELNVVQLAVSADEGPARNDYEDVVKLLAGLGYSVADSRRALHSIIEEAGEEVSLIDEANLVAKSLQRLSSL